jgi:hypothetical protein
VQFINNNDLIQKNSILNEVKTFQPGITIDRFEELTRIFPPSHFQRLLDDGFRFYHNTFWYPLERNPENIFESIVTSLITLANPSANAIGVEWWFSVLKTNATPQWLLPCHFDRNDLAERDFNKIKYPEKSSVLFLNAVPYGELVVTDQMPTEKGPRPKQPKDMRFIQPDKNLYAVFPGNLYHGVIGRMWRSIEPTELRLAMAVNWWTEQPKAPYLKDSREAIDVFCLN